MKTFLLTMTLAAVTVAAGCTDPAGPKPNGTDTKSAPVPAMPTAAEAFQKPLPATVADDPRVVQAKAASDTVTRTLGTIQERLTAHRKSYDDKLAGETDLRRLVQRLLPLVKAAREDCDTIQRTVLDLRTEMRHAQAGYQAAADLYRDRANSYADPDLRAITSAMADEFERLAADVPRRRAVLNAFNWQLGETALFLADTERCLRETEAALSILTAGPDPISVSAQSKAFRRQLEEFFALLDEYRRQLLGAPRSPEARNTPETPKVSPPATKPGAGGDGTATPRPGGRGEQPAPPGEKPGAKLGAERERPAPETAPPPSVPKASPVPALPPVYILPTGNQPLRPGQARQATLAPSEAAKLKRP